jgi:hypothetical protein
LTIGELHQIPSILQAIARCNLIETFMARLAQRWQGAIVRFDALWSGKRNTGERAGEREGDAARLQPGGTR